MANNEHPAFKLFGKTIKADSDKRPPPSSSSSSSSSEPAVAAEERPAADEQQHAAAAAARAASGRPLPCPRCKSKETKFCYFNNYNVNQPRHFCKSCHRYWTAGGTLRNVPVGAGRRKNHRGAPPPPAAEDQVEVSTWIKS